MNVQTETETAPIGRGRALVAAAFLFTAAVSSASLYATSNNPPLHQTENPLGADDAINNVHRSLSLALPHGGCQVTYAHLSPVDIAPTWQASFPGSGARMTFSLVEALTGIRTNDDYNSHERGYERVVAVKTHYPVKDARRRFGDLDPLFGRAMVVLRNPMDAIPSYFNLQYEHQHHLPNHSTRGPNEDWIKYRDDKSGDLAYRLNSYEKFVTYWMERYPDRRQLLMISYEELTDDFAGPITAMRIANFLAETEGVDPIVPESVPCVWETIVNYKNVAPPQKGKINAVIKEAREEATAVPDDQVAEEANTIGRKLKRNERRKDEGNGRRALQDANIGDETMLKPGRTHADPSSLRVGPKVRPYTTENLQAMLDMFQRLMDKYSHDEDFVRIMRSYIATVSIVVPQDN